MRAQRCKQLYNSDNEQGTILDPNPSHWLTGILVGPLAILKLVGITDDQNQRTVEYFDRLKGRIFELTNQRYVLTSYCTISVIFHEPPFLMLLQTRWAVSLHWLVKNEFPSSWIMTILSI
jgi:hypothetical protein